MIRRKRIPGCDRCGAGHKVLTGRELETRGRHVLLLGPLAWSKCLLTPSYRHSPIPPWAHRASSLSQVLPAGGGAVKNILCPAAACLAGEAITKAFHSCIPYRKRERQEESPRQALHSQGTAFAGLRTLQTRTPRKAGFHVLNAAGEFTEQDGKSS